MDGSDDYFTDEILLDDHALAVLDEEEQKYITQASGVPPVTKRLRTDYGWKPGPGSWSAALDENEDLPEISLRDDGSYGVRGARSTPSGTGNINGQAIQNNSAPRHRVVVSSSTSPSKLQHPALAQPTLPQITSRSPLALQLQRPSHGRIPLVSHGQDPSTGRPNSHNKTSRTSYNSDESTTSRTRPSPLRDLTDVGLRHPLERQFEELKMKLEQLNRENTEIQAALKETNEMKLAKEGEVSILRIGIEKTAQDHAIQIARLKSAKEEADAKQLQMQKELKEEVERLKTQFIFKQHELQSSARKSPLTVRSKKISKGPPATPMPLPTQMREWNAKSGASAGLNQLFEESSTQSVSHTTFKNHHNTLHHRKSLEKLKQPINLPGFQNAFMPSTPLHPPSQHLVNGKQRETAAVPRAQQHYTNSTPTLASPSAGPFRYPRYVDADIKMDDPMSTTARYDANLDQNNMSDGDGDVEIIKEHDNDSVLDESDAAEPFDWKAELTRIILTHSLSSSPSLTFQLLLGVPITTAVPVGSAEKHFTACTCVLEAIANTTKHDDRETAVDRVSHSLLLMIPILSAANSFLALAALLNLLTVLIYSFPHFLSKLLSQPHSANEIDSHIVTLLCELIQDHLEASKQYVHKDQLASELITLLETLCFNVDDEMVDKLALISHSLTTLLHTNQPQWLLARSSRLLVLLATHRKLCRPLLSMPDLDTQAREHPADLTKISLIERLCSHLIDINRRVAEFQTFKTSVLTFFALLSISQRDVHAALLGSTVVIPSLVTFLAQLTTPLWEDDEKLMTCSSQDIALTIRTLNQSVFLLHHLVFSSVPVFNLRHKLYHTQLRPFSGITHMFIVTFGRLSYADPPRWVGDAERLELELLSGRPSLDPVRPNVTLAIPLTALQTEMARDLLDLVVDGPECDSIWAAYQTEPDQDRDIDEEEMEASLLG